jgi:hypothetical protein
MEKETTPVAPVSSVAVLAENNRIRVHINLEESTPKSSAYADNFKVSLNVSKDYDLSRGDFDLNACIKEVSESAASSFDELKNNFETINETHIRKDKISQGYTPNEEIEQKYVSKEVANKTFLDMKKAYEEQITRLKAMSNNPQVINPNDVVDEAIKKFS